MQEKATYQWQEKCTRFGLQVVEIRRWGESLHGNRFFSCRSTVGNSFHLRQNNQRPCENNSSDTTITWKWEIAVKAEFARTHWYQHGETCYLCTELLLQPFDGLFSRTTWVSWYQKGKSSLDLNDTRDDRVLGCSGISWTIRNLHLAPDRQPHQHLITQFLKAGCSSWRPTNSVKAVKAVCGCTA